MKLFKIMYVDFQAWIDSSRHRKSRFQGLLLLLLWPKCAALNTVGYEVQHLDPRTHGRRPGQVSSLTLPLTVAFDLGLRGPPQSRAKTPTY